MMLAFVSCEMDNGLPGNEKPGTLFSATITSTQATIPGGATSDSIGLTVNLNWASTPGSRYQVEYSRDNFATVDKVLNSDSGHVQIPGLWGATLQYLRVKTLSKDPLIKDSKYSTISFTTNSEQIFSPSSYTPTADSVVLRWDSTRLVSNIRVSTIGLPDSTILLSSLDKQHGRKTMKNMLNKAYTFKLLGKYSELQVRGTTTVTFNYKVITFNTQVAGVNVNPIKVNAGKIATKPSNPIAGASQPQGAVFVNWYKEPACINVFNFVTTAITNDITLYAKWQ
jgi:uncharacterized repeat protein (TIGR02543 family)